MKHIKRFQQVPEAPTRPGDKKAPRRFDVAELYQGPAGDAGTAEAPEADSALGVIDEKLRQAYYWIVNHAVINPYYDIEFLDEAPEAMAFGDSKTPLVLPTDQSYSSYVLLPLLNLPLRRRCLLVGGPGRGKTAIATLMGVLAGYPLRDVKRAIQHGQPQMTIADLLGNPLPSSLVAAKSMDEVAVSWRKWLGMKVKIIDEYNRIPTRTQSALLTVMADNYAEIYDHIYECPEAAWYLTANDDAGGGTYQVIEALRDRIDVTVASLHFNTRFLGELLLRVEDDFRPEEIAPKEIVFTEKELDRINERIREVEIPLTVRRRLEFFAANFEFLEPAAQRLEYMTKDTCKLAGEDPAQLLAGETGRDKLADLGGQSMNGLSVRALMTLLLFTKAMAFFRGHHEAELEDLRQVMPFVLYDKLVQNQDHPSLDTDETKALRTDRISWVRVLFDKACREYDRQNLDTDDPVAEVAAAFEKGLAGLGEKEVRKRMADITAKLAEWSQGRKLHGPLLDDVLALKYYHQRYQNYLRWLLNR